MSADGGHALLGMINDLLDISKMESGTISLERAPVDPAGVIEAAVRQVLQLAAEKSLRLSVELPPGLPAVEADGEKLRRVLVNLLGNAIKFTPREGSVTVLAGRLPEGVLFAVRDTGEGIPREAFDRIFEKFGQVESRKGGGGCPPAWVSRSARWPWRRTAAKSGWRASPEKEAPSDSRCRCDSAAAKATSKANTDRHGRPTLVPRCLPRFSWPTPHSHC